MKKDKVLNEELNEELYTEEQIEQILLNSQELGQMMEQLVKNQIVVKDEMINKLHKELEYYKQSSAEKFEEQLMKAVIKIRKDMGRLITSEKWDTFSVEDLKREYQYAFEDVTDLLEQQNVDAYKTKELSDFDPAIHQAKIEITTEIELDKKIKESISEGYKKGDKVLIPERVVVYQYQAL